MPHVPTRDPFSTTGNPCFLGNQKPSIVCIAAHAYRQRKAQKTEQEYATSFMKTEDYIASLRGEVNKAVFRDGINGHGTPLYVLDEINGIYHSPAHPLIQKGLLAPTKNAQYRGHAVRPEKVWSTAKPQPLPANRSFYRPNSTHNYLTKTITLGGSHDGFNPKLGTPTRAQLLRNRVRFTSAPDLTYAYIAQKRPDGKQEAIHRKNKVEEELLQLKASKIEMDRTAAKYRQFMIGSQYNTAKWIDSHVTLVHDLIAVKNRPASSVTPKPTPVNANTKRRAVSATANQEHLRKDANQPVHKAHKNQAETETVSLTKRKTFPTPSYQRKAVRTGMKCSSVEIRSANLVPYSASVNSPGCVNDGIDSLFIIKSVQESQDSLKSKQFTRRLELAKELKLKIENSANSSISTNHHDGSAAANIIGSPVSLPMKKDIKENRRVKSGVKVAAEQSADNSDQFFVTNPPNEQTLADSKTASHMIPMNTKVSTDLESDSINDLTIDGNGLTRPNTAYQQGEENSATLSSRTKTDNGGGAANERLQNSFSRPHSVSVELPAASMENVSDSSSLTFELIEEPAIDAVQSAQSDDNLENNNGNHLTATVENGGSIFNDANANGSSQFVDETNLLDKPLGDAQETITPADILPDLNGNAHHAELEAPSSVNAPTITDVEKDRHTPNDF